MNPGFFVSIDFDGTIATHDITDEVIKKFAKPGWEEAEELWEKGLIGSRECLERQMSLIDASLDEVLDYVDNFSIDRYFTEFTNYLTHCNIPFAIISDGFHIFVKRLLENEGIKNVPVYANELVEENGKLKTVFPFSNKYCLSGTCKCAISEQFSNDIPVILIGDGKSDFCIADKADYVFSKGKLSAYCKIKNIPYHPFDNFKDLKRNIIKLKVNNSYNQKKYIFEEFTRERLINDTSGA